MEIIYYELPKVRIKFSYMLIPCRTANKDAYSNILFLVDVLPDKNVFLSTLLLQELLAYKTVFGF